MTSDPCANIDFFGGHLESYTRTSSGLRRTLGGKNFSIEKQSLLDFRKSMCFAEDEFNVQHLTSVHTTAKQRNRTGESNRWEAER